MLCCLQMLGVWFLSASMTGIRGLPPVDPPSDLGFNSQRTTGFWNWRLDSGPWRGPIVGAFLAQNEVLPALGSRSARLARWGRLVDQSVAAIPSRADETVAHVRAVPGPIDQIRALDPPPPVAGLTRIRRNASWIIAEFRRGCLGPVMTDAGVGVSSSQREERGIWEPGRSLRS